MMKPNQKYNSRDSNPGCNIDWQCWRGADHLARLSLGDILCQVPVIELFSKRLFPREVSYCSARTFVSLGALEYSQCC